MTKGIVDYAFNQKGVDLVYAVTVPENIGSRKVLEKAGFADKGIIDFLAMHLSFYQITS
ncbi:GNAT family N-acetyltransferase [Mucilaginibacter ginkgonis]|uniref:GNAT family N-acetyltransferase n=1 Tax=Mucilaginibacter ginkgonis TaxID=2682091 RepID=A0A6I4I299_9SPHI|nr:GNAT family N-acetyltransferase [Mucilaginibacter ginkgonis]